MIRTFFLAVAAILGLAPLGVAQVQDVFIVRGLEVDETADMVIEAQQAAFAAAKFEGLFEMVSRLTLPEDLAAADSLLLDQVTADYLTAAVDVEQETRGAGRYRGKLAVVFNQARLREFLETAGIPYTDQMAPRTLLVPVASGGYGGYWTATVEEDLVARLVPVSLARPGSYSSASGWNDLSAEASEAGASRAVLAELTGQRGQFQVRLLSVTAAGVQQIGLTAPQPSVRAAAQDAGTLLDQIWKRASIVRETERNILQATVSYTSLAEWNTLRQALVQSPQISNFATVAIARDGALVRFVFAGNGERLIADLRDRGVMISNQPIGWVLSSATLSGRQEP